MGWKKKIVMGKKKFVREKENCDGKKKFVREKKKDAMGKAKRYVEGKGLDPPENERYI